MRHAIKLASHGRIESGMVMPVEVTPQAADSIQVLAAVDIGQDTTRRLLDDEWLVLLHLRKAMPNVLRVPAL